MANLFVQEGEKRSYTSCLTLSFVSIDIREGASGASADALGVGLEMVSGLKFHPNWTKTAKVCYWGAFSVGRVGGWDGKNVPPAIQLADILLLTTNYTSPPSFSQIGVSYSGCFWGGWTLPSESQCCTH